MKSIYEYENKPIEKFPSLSIFIALSMVTIFVFSLGFISGAVTLKLLALIKN